MFTKFANNIPVQTPKRRKEKLRPVLEGAAQIMPARSVKGAPAVSTAKPKTKSKAPPAKVTPAAAKPVTNRTTKTPPVVPNSTATGSNTRITPNVNPYAGAVIPPTAHTPINSTISDLVMRQPLRQLKPEEAAPTASEFFRSPIESFQRLRALSKPPREGLRANPEPREVIAMRELLNSIGNIPTTDVTPGVNAATNIQIPSLGIRPPGPPLRQLQPSEAAPSTWDMFSSPLSGFNKLRGLSKPPRAGLRASPEQRLPYATLKTMLNSDAPISQRVAPPVPTTPRRSQL